MASEERNFKVDCTKDPKEPFFHFVPSERLADFLVHDGEAREVFPVEGHLDTKEVLLASIAKALIFPDYFGGNWDALDESIKDLSWLPAQRFVLLVKNGDDLLKLPRKDWDILFGVFSEAVEFWQDEGTPFHLVLAGGEALSQRLKALVEKPICFHYT